MTPDVLNFMTLIVIAVGIASLGYILYFTRRLKARGGGPAPRSTGRKIVRNPSLLAYLVTLVLIALGAAVFYLIIYM